MSKAEGFVKEVMLQCGEVRYQAIARVQGRYAYLGWWTTPQKAEKALNNAFS